MLLQKLMIEQSNRNLINSVHSYKLTHKCNKYELLEQLNRLMYSSVRKKGAFIFELIMERYIYLRNTQKQLKITNYVRNKSFFKFYLVYNGVCLKLLESLL